MNRFKWNLIYDISFSTPQNLCVFSYNRQLIQNIDFVNIGITTLKNVHWNVVPKSQENFSVIISKNPCLSDIVKTQKMGNGDFTDYISSQNLLYWCESNFGKSKHYWHNPVLNISTENYHNGIIFKKLHNEK